MCVCVTARVFVQACMQSFMHACLRTFMRVNTATRLRSAGVCLTSRFYLFTHACLFSSIQHKHNFMFQFVLSLCVRVCVCVSERTHTQLFRSVAASAAVRSAHKVCEMLETASCHQVCLQPVIPSEPGGCSPPAPLPPPPLHPAAPWGSESNLRPADTSATPGFPGDLHT